MEEPEAHLHPKNQRVLVKYIVRLIKQGLNFIITTHSDYILEQVANMVLLKDVPEEDRINEFGFEKDDYLDREQVGIYLFEKKEFKSYTTNEIQIGKLGIPESSFTHVIDSLYGESHNIKKYLYG
jgi:predicted ATPase